MRYLIAFTLLAACGTDTSDRCELPPGEVVAGILASSDAGELDRWEQTAAQLAAADIEAVRVSPETRCGAEIAATLITEDAVTLPLYIIVSDGAPAWEGEPLSFYVEARQRWGVRLEYRQALGPVATSQPILLPGPR